MPTPHPKLYIARARVASAEQMQGCLAWLAATQTADATEVKARLLEWIPEYQPQSAP